MAQTKLIPVVLDMITETDLEDLRQQIHHRELRMKRIERITQQAYDQGGVLSLLDLAVLFTVSEMTAGQYTREFHSLYGRLLPTRGNVQLIGGGQTHKQEIIALHLKGWLVPAICTKTNHSKEAVERYINDFEAIRLLSTKFNDVDTISRIRRLAPSVVKQYLDLIPSDD
jgi:hypothetical protein